MFTKTERMACRILSHLRHDGTNFINCKFNDFLFVVVKLMRIDPVGLIKKVIKQMPN